MSNWIGGLPPEPKAKEDKKKRGGSKPASPLDGGHPKSFYGGAIPPVPPKLPKYKKDEPLPKVIITGAGHPLVKSIAPKSPKASPPSPPATPSTPPLPLPPPPPPPPPPSPVSDSTPQSYSPLPPPKRLPSVFDKKPKKKKKKKKKKPHLPAPKPIECYNDKTCADSEGEGNNLGNLPSIFAMCHIPATRQGQSLEDYGGYGEKEDRSGQASPRCGEEDEGPDIPPAVPSYMRPDEFARIFGKKIDARNIAELGPHGWHPSANAPYDITDRGDIVTVGPSGWHEPRSE